MHPRRTVRTALGMLQCASLLLAQQPPAVTPPEVVFSVTTTRVQVDAVVTDSKGHYVTDLTADDFGIYLDGKQQKITNFSYVSVSLHAPLLSKSERKATPKPSPMLPPAPSTPARQEDVRRTIVLMVDDLGISFEDMAYVRNSLRKFIEQQMQPGDLVAICRTGAGSGAVQQFTMDKRILFSVADGLRWNPNGRAGVNFFEPYGKYSNLAQQIGAPGAGNQGSGIPDRLDVNYNVQRNTNFTLGTLGAIRYFVGALREMPGRKSIVLFSDGLQLFTPGEGPVMHSGMDSVQNNENNADIQEALHKLLDGANRAGTVIYTVHTAGLQAFQPDAQDRVDLTGMNQQQVMDTLHQITGIGLPGRGHIGGRDLQFNSSQQGLAYLALETGGIAYQNGNDFNYGLDKVLQDQSGYYLIGFKPPSDTFEEKHGARSYHHVAVKVTRPGLHVRSRSGFFGETDDETSPKYKTPLEQMRAAMLSPFRSSDVRLRLTALYAEVPKRGAVVRNLLHIDAQDLTFQTVLDSTTHTADSSAQVEIVAVATSMGYLPVSAVAQSYKVQASADRLQEALKEGVVYTLDVPVKKPGAYQIQVAVRDTVTGKVGSASQFLEIPELKKGRVALTSVLLQSAQRAAGTPAWTGMSPATRQFHPGGEIEYFCLLENAGKQVPDVDLDSQIRIVRDGKDVYTGPAKLVAIEGGGRAVTGGLKLSEKMTPGDYYLGVIVRDRTAKNRVTAQWTDFEILQ
jgi:VWFA-related protein